MKKKKYFNVAGHYFSVEADDYLLEKMTDYQPFQVNESPTCLFEVMVSDASFPGIDYEVELHHEDGELTAIHGHTADKRDVFIYRWHRQDFFWFICEKGYLKGTLTITSIMPKVALDFALTIIFRYRTIKMMTTPIHASTISYQGKAYLFLGISGTGKSTHSQLWLKSFEGAELVNDDKPIIRIMENGEVRAFGSPWSGKTACYRNVNYPVGGIVKLNQAPHNKIRRLKPVEAYFILLQSINGKRWDNTVSNDLHRLEEEIVRRVPMWHLECLPDEEAAKLCRDTITELK